MSMPGHVSHFDIDSSLAALSRFAAKGFVVSLAYGPCGDPGVRWSVDVLSPSGLFFDKPFEADCLGHAIAIAIEESTKRGWVPC